MYCAALRTQVELKLKCIYITHVPIYVYVFYVNSIFSHVFLVLNFWYLTLAVFQ